MHSFRVGATKNLLRMRKHFDPEIAKLFLASKEEAIEIAEKHMEDS